MCTATVLWPVAVPLRSTSNAEAVSVKEPGQVIPRKHAAGSRQHSAIVRWIANPLFVAGVADRVQQIVGRGNALGAIDDRAVFADDEDRSVDLFGEDARLPWNRLERAIIGGHLQPLVDEQFERQLQMCLEPLVTVEVTVVDAEWDGIETSIGVDCPANRGQLVRSPRGEIFRVEDEQ